MRKTCWLVLLCFAVCSLVLRAEEENKWQRKDFIPIDLAKLRYLQETNQLKEAWIKAKALEQQFPASSDVLIALAQIEYELTRWKKAYLLLNQAHTLEPYNESICNFKKDILTTYGQQTLAGVKLKTTSYGLKERISYLGTERFINFNWKLGSLIEIDRVTYDFYTDVQTNLQKSIRSNFYRVEVFLEGQFLSGLSTKASLWAARGMQGVSAEIINPDFLGEWRVFGAYNKPEWDFIQSVIDEGGRDTVNISRFHKITKDFNVTLSLGWNNYSLLNERGLASSVSLEAFALYRLFPPFCVRNFLGDDSEIGLQYFLDAEYFYGVVSKVDGFGNSFQPFSASDRETHTFAFFLSKYLCESFYFQGYIGYFVTRFGKGGEVGEVIVRFSKKHCFDIEVVANRSQDTNSSGSSDSIYINFIGHF